jgi:TolB-like protein/DNA-binding winged helix-turn-helix (wHTH) protein/Tfp pilus assembly protein PilF
MDIALREQGVYAFGPFRLDPARRTLLRDGDTLKLSERLFDTLLYLVVNQGRLVQRDELIRAVWGGRSVEDSNLSQAILALRRLLQADGGAEKYIVTAAGRGYRFAAPVTFLPEPVREISSVPAAAPETGLVRRARWARPLPALVSVLLLLLVSSWLAARLVVPDRSSPRDARAFVPPPHSIAVLPFSNLSGDPGQEYVSDGVSEELIGSLTRIRQLRVSARTSSFSLKGRTMTVGDIGRLLNVGAVLEGSVRRQGNRVRITADLSDAVTGFQLWSQRFDRDQADLLAVQADIAATVTSALKVTLLGAEASTFTLGGSSNPAAFDIYLHGMDWIHASDITSEVKALAAFQRAIALDPAFAQAHLECAMALVNLVNNADYDDPVTVRRLQEEALAHARQAVALAPDLPAAHAELSSVLAIVDLDFTGAELEIKKAYGQAPSDVRTLMSYARLLTQLGHPDEAIAKLELAVSLDPLSPSAFEQLAYTLPDAGRYADAKAALKNALRLARGPVPGGQALICQIELDQGDAAGARRDCAAGDDWQEVEWLAIADHALGRTAQASEDLARLHAMAGDTAALNYAEIYAQWGQTGNALHWLQEADRLHDAGLMELKADRWLDPVRKTEEFTAIQQKMNFPP